VAEVAGGSEGLARGAVAAFGGGRGAREVGERDAEALGEERDFVGFGGEPVGLGLTQNCVEEHEPARDGGGAGVTPVAIVLLPKRAVDGARVQVIEVSAVAAIGEPTGEPARDEGVEEVAGVLAVGDACAGGILPAQAVAAVERDEDEEARLAGGEAEGREGIETSIEGHGAGATGRGGGEGAGD
jgi:hypothetical protein